MYQNQNRTVSTRNSPNDARLENMDISGQMLGGQPYPPVNRPNQPIAVNPRSTTTTAVPAAPVGYVPQGATALQDMDPNRAPNATSGNRYNNLIRQPIANSIPSNPSTASPGYQPIPNNSPVNSGARPVQPYTPIYQPNQSPDGGMPANPAPSAYQPIGPGYGR